VNFAQCPLDSDGWQKITLSIPDWNVVSGKSRKQDRSIAEHFHDGTVDFSFVPHDGAYARTAAGVTFNMPWVSMKRTISGKPCPVFRLLNRKGLSARILRASRSMTSREAPT